MIVIALAVFWRVSSYGFLNYDDDKNVYENRYVEQFTLSNTLHFWKGPYNGLYIPVTYNLWAFQARLSEFFPADSSDTDLNPRVFHTTNLAIHLLSMLVVFYVLRTLVRDDLSACAGALLFAIHPVQVEPVAWVTGLKDVLGGFLSLVALWQYISYANLTSAPVRGGGGRGHRRYIVATIAFVLAMLAKPSAVVVPLVAGILGYWVLKRSFRRNLLELIPWVALAVPIIIWTRLTQRSEVPVMFIPAFWERLLVAGDALTFYVYKLVMPVSMGPDYGRSPELVLEHGWIYLTGSIPYILAIILLWKNRRPWLLASTGIFVAAILPVLGFVPFMFQDISTVADRYVYFAMLGPALGLGWFLSHHRSIPGRVICVLVLGILGLRSAHQTQCWNDSRTFFEHALVVNSNSWLAHNNLGIILQDEGKFQQAITHYTEAFRINPRDAKAHNNLASILVEQNKLEEAIAHYTEALKISPNFAKAHTNLGLALRRQGKLEEAIAHYTEALRLNPNNPKTHNNMGVALQRQGKLKDALAHYTQALRLDPGNARAHNNLGLGLREEGRLEEAISHFNEALRLRPNYAKAHYNLGLTLEEQGRLEEAIAHFAEALKINPDFEQARRELTRALQQKKQQE